MEQAGPEPGSASELSESDVAADALVQVRHWFDAQAALQPRELVVGSLATVDADGQPDARFVIVRGLDARGVHWFSNRDSAKGRQLRARPTAAISIYWRVSDRQIRLRGAVEALPDPEADAYFAGRPRQSQIGAWASHQSTPIADRAALDRQVAEVEERFAGAEVPRPDFWVGYLLRPAVVELWQARPGRLHDRLRYTREGDGWHVERLQP